MKKLVIISLAIFGLGIVSCQKQDITPNEASELQVPVSGTEVPVWEDNARVGNTDADDGENGITEGINITDPEVEEEETKNKLKENGD